MADSTFAHYLRIIDHWSNIYKDPGIESDSLVIPSNELMKYAKQELTQPETMTAPFRSAVNEGLVVASSDDSKLRCYAWDTYIGGSMHVYDALMQYASGEQIKVKTLNDLNNYRDRPDPGAYPTEITTMYTQTGKTVYLVVDCSIVSDKEKSYGIKAYSMQDGTLEVIPFFKNGKMMENNINYVFNTIPGKDSLPHELNMIHLSQDKSKLFIPIIYPNGTLSDAYKEYEFDGSVFDYKRKTRKG